MLRRGRDIYNRHGFRPLPSFARFSAVQDDAAIFGHTRPAGFDTMLLQQFSNGRIRYISLPQIRDKFMNWFQIVERDTMRIRPELLNGFAQSFEIGR